MGLGNKKTRNVDNTERIKEALDVLKDKENLRQVYDYNLRVLISAVEDELSKRDQKRSHMINSIKDMCEFMIEKGENSHYFHYIRRSPQELMQYAGDDEITDEGYYNLCSQLDEKRSKAAQYKGKKFLIKRYPEDSASACFEVEMIDMETL